MLAVAYIAVLTLVGQAFMAGFYSMNFEHMPELRLRYSYPALWVAMLVVAAAMVYFFYRRGWLRSGDD